MRMKRKARNMQKSIHNQEYLKIIMRLRSARKAAGLTQIEAARRIGRPQSFISKLSRAKGDSMFSRLRNFQKFINNR